MDHVFEALAHPRRRYALYTLLEDTEVSLQDLAEQITAWEDEAPEETLYDDEVEQVYVSLYHNHVQKLVEDGIVEFDEATETIEPGPNAEQVLTVLEASGGSLDSQQEKHARNNTDDRHP